MPMLAPVTSAVCPSPVRAMCASVVGRDSTPAALMALALADSRHLRPTARVLLASGGQRRLRSAVALAGLLVLLAVVVLDRVLRAEHLPQAALTALPTDDENLLGVRVL